MPRPTAGWTIAHTTNTNIVGIIQEFDVTHEGDSEEISGTNSALVGTVVRQIHKPVDVGVLINFSGKVDESASGYTNFVTAMENRTEDTKIILKKGSDEYEYVGFAESYSESMSRSEAVWNFNASFRVNEIDPS
jgi:hypothetical protein